jgi:tRNA G26 N,N-dimethylase Trm1
VPEGFSVRTEGKASILQSGNDVFFNPAQVINRDMSLSGACSSLWSSRTTILCCDVPNLTRPWLIAHMLATLDVCSAQVLHCAAGA